MSASAGPFSLVVNAAAPSPLTLTPSSGTLPPATENVSYDSDVLEISGGVAPYNLSNPAGVPAGLALSIFTDGVTVILSGTPTVGDAASSPYSITFTVTDSSGGASTPVAAAKTPAGGQLRPKDAAVKGYR